MFYRFIYINILLHNIKAYVSTEFQFFLNFCQAFEMLYKKQIKKSVEMFVLKKSTSSDSSNERPFQDELNGTEIS